MRALPVLAALSLAGLGSLAAPAAAATFSYEVAMPNAGPGSDRAGQLQNLAFAYDDGGNSLNPAQSLSASGSIAINTQVGTPEGGWFVLSPGPDAKDVERGLAILYMDLASGSVVAYEYDGTLGVLGFQTFAQQDRYIATFENAVSTEVSNGVLSFEIDDLDVSVIQGFSEDEGYTGVSFGEQIGVWFHLAVFNSIGVDADGRITAFAPRFDSFFDAVNLDSLAPVPLPAGLVLFGTGAAGVAAMRRRRKA